jgi:hypothetical protein
MPTEWWTVEDDAPPVRALEAPRQMECGSVRVDGSIRAAHAKQALVLPRGFWKGAAHVLIARFYEDGTWSLDDVWSWRNLL